MTKVCFSRSIGCIGLAASLLLIVAPVAAELVVPAGGPLAATHAYTPGGLSIDSADTWITQVPDAAPAFSASSWTGRSTGVGEESFEVLKPDPALPSGGIVSSAVGVVLHFLPTMHEWAMASLVTVLMAATFAMLLFDQRRVSESVRFGHSPAPQDPHFLSNLRGSIVKSSAAIFDRYESFADHRLSLTRKAAHLLDHASNQLVPRTEETSEEVVDNNVAPIDPMKQLLTRIVLALVDHEDRVVISETLRDNTQVFVVHVAGSDVGKVLGRRGSNIFAIRTLMTAVSGRIRKKYSVEIAEQGRRRRKSPRKR